ncbi:caspase family protein [Polaromonas glacialis]|uniref:caspase family protein n=1 Tax=Polaromonas glacialis TaxID=866564 RepID=UPI000689FAFC|nr:caspase family protein [Polaromonas glacialis]
MAKGIAVNIGLNFVNPAAYNGWDGALAGCINDARDMNQIATQLGYTATMLTDAQATASEVTRVIGQAARQLAAGDICLVSYSGHGSQINDVTGDEPDGKDETWVLWDRQLLDDELNGLWSSFAAGVRIFLLSDSCHSGTVARVMSFQKKFKSAEFAAQYGRPVNAPPRVRAADPAAVHANYLANKSNYEVSQWTHRASVNASVTLISGCQDNQLSSDGDANGLFTQRLKEVWNGGAFSGSYAQFHSAIVARMPSDQTPNLFRSGVSNPAFDAEKPFTIGTGSAGGGTGSGGLSISAPSSFANGATPVTFAVSVPSGQYFAVEVATEAGLFNSTANGGQRNDNNFYASWKVSPFRQDSSFTVPLDAWNRLRQGASRLYYRLWCTSSPTAWVNYRVTTTDSNAQAAPSLTLTTQSQPGSGGGDTPAITAPTAFPANGAAPRFQVNPGAGRYYAVEVSTNSWYFTDQYSAQRNDNNFYGSWKVSPFQSSALYPAGYTLPAEVWSRLRDNATNGRLYYRMWWTESPTQWVGHGCTTPNSSGQNAPSFALSREFDMEAFAQSGK